MINNEKIMIKLNEIDDKLDGLLLFIESLEFEIEKLKNEITKHINLLNTAHKI